jgi:hypothetical protein
VTSLYVLAVQGSLSRNGRRNHEHPSTKKQRILTRVRHHRRPSIRDRLCVRAHITMSQPTQTAGDRAEGKEKQRPETDYAQVQADCAVAPVVRVTALATHEVHAWLPARPLNLPVTQAVQGPPGNTQWATPIYQQSLRQAWLNDG